MVDVTDRIYETTAVRRGNLARLADLLERVVPPPEFDMSCYLRTSPVRRLAVDEELNRVKNWSDMTVRWREIDPVRNAGLATRELYQECGTVACAAGHGPMAGVPARPGEDWYDYTERCFTGGDNDAFNYMFGAQWKKIDNTPKGAAARIRRYLAEGTPDLYSAASVQNRGRSYSLSDFICDASYSGSVMGDAMRQFLLDTYAEYLVIDADV